VKLPSGVFGSSPSRFSTFIVPARPSAPTVKVTEATEHTNTLKAHQLIHYAKAHGRQLEMKERLLRAYFVEGRHIGRVDDLADLADLAADLGLDRADVLRALNDDEHLDAVAPTSSEEESP
jgi:predicted DsbA family dithiol-disulfide isomerase